MPRHDRLGCRNFAAFVNEYRLREVGQRLLDPALDRRPILTLVTPTEFRARRSLPAQ